MDRVGVVLDSGPLYANIIVNAAGPWAPIIAKMVGIELEIRVVREQDSICRLAAIGHYRPFLFLML